MNAGHMVKLNFMKIFVAEKCTKIHKTLDQIIRNSPHKVIKRVESVNGDIVYKFTAVGLINISYLFENEMREMP